MIKSAAKKAISGDSSECTLILPPDFEIEIFFKDYQKAYKNSFYPGAEIVGSNTIGFVCQDYFDFLRFLSFAL